MRNYCNVTLTSNSNRDTNTAKFSYYDILQWYMILHYTVFLLIFFTGIINLIGYRD